MGHFGFPLWVSVSLFGVLGVFGLWIVQTGLVCMGASFPLDPWPRTDIPPPRKLLRGIRGIRGIGRENLENGEAVRPPEAHRSYHYHFHFNF